MRPRRIAILAERGLGPSGALRFPFARLMTATLVREALEEDAADSDITSIATIPTARRARGRIVARKRGVIAGISLAREALEEDAADSDITSIATIPTARRARGRIVARKRGVIAGIPLAREAFRQRDTGASVRATVKDGQIVDAGAEVMFITASPRGLLSAERVALNFLQRLSGVATLTHEFVDAIAGTSAKILDTRKTTPGWRRLEKYAVRAGGGTNHRNDLGSAVLIKDNHLAALEGDVQMAVSRARQIGPGKPIEVECDDITQVQASVDAGADIIMLDNMSLAKLKQAVALIDGRAVSEASGGVTL